MSGFSAALQKIDRQANAELDSAFAQWYPELKKIAHARLRGSGLHGNVQTTALVHDSYLKLASGSGLAFGDRLRFFSYASRALRSIVIDTVREQRALRRGGEAEHVTLDTAAGEGVPASADIETVNDALEDLEKLDRGLAREAIDADTRLPAEIRAGLIVRDNAAGAKTNLLSSRCALVAMASPPAARRVALLQEARSLLRASRAFKQEPVSRARPGEIPR